LRGARGAGKITPPPPPVHVLNPRPSCHLPASLFFSTFLGATRSGEFKNTINLQNVHVGKEIRQKPTNISMPGFLRFVLFYHIFESFSAMAVQQTTKTCLQTIRVEKAVSLDWA
jgi:hypothetical protein